jgi:hypothetical protein
MPVAVTQWPLSEIRQYLSVSLQTSQGNKLESDGRKVYRHKFTHLVESNMEEWFTDDGSFAGMKDLEQIPLGLDGR